MIKLFTKEIEHPLKKCVDEFIGVRREVYPIATLTHEEFLVEFLEQCNKPLIEITTEDIESFKDHVFETHHSVVMREYALGAVSCFLRYWRGKGHKYLPQITFSQSGENGFYVL